MTDPDPVMPPEPGPDDDVIALDVRERVWYRDNGLWWRHGDPDGHNWSYIDAPLCYIPVDRMTKRLVAAQAELAQARATIARVEALRDLYASHSGTYVQAAKSDLTRALRPQPEPEEAP